MRYEFDPAKLAANVLKHGVWFATAEDFEWETAQIEIDGRKHYGESRFTATGLIGSRLFVLTFTLRDTTVRIISLRKANFREVRRYASNAQN
ncbi:MAG: BrnT family toxin [Burkholderiaceae bacterium]